MVLLQPDWLTWMERGAAVVVASGSRAGVPDVVRAIGLRAVGERRLRLLFNAGSCDVLLRNLQENPRVAVTCTRIEDFRCLQLKGVAAPDVVHAADHDVAAKYRREFVAKAEMVFAQSTWKGFRFMRCAAEVAVVVDVDEAFDQTPGATAGDPVGPGSEVSP